MMERGRVKKAERKIQNGCAQKKNSEMLKKRDGWIEDRYEGRQSKGGRNTKIRLGAA